MNLPAPAAQFCLCCFHRQRHQHAAVMPFPGAGLVLCVHLPEAAVHLLGRGGNWPRLPHDLFRHSIQGTQLLAAFVVPLLRVTSLLAGKYTDIHM